MPVVRLRQTTTHVAALYATPRQPRLMPRPLLVSPRIQAGFPSPAADYIEEVLDLNDLLVRNPPATFYVRVQGDSMVDALIFDGDILVVDRSLDATPGRIVVAAADGDLLVKRLRKIRGRLALCSENAARPDYRPVYLDRTQDSTVWGVVTGLVRKF